MAVALFMVCFASSASAREIGAGAFSNCHSLKEVVILGEVKIFQVCFPIVPILKKLPLIKRKLFVAKKNLIC